MRMMAKRVKRDIHSLSISEPLKTSKSFFRGIDIQTDQGGLAVSLVHVSRDDEVLKLGG